MAYQFKDATLAKLVKKVRKGKVTKKRAKKRTAKRRTAKRRKAPSHFPSELATALGYARPRRKRASKKRAKTTVKRAKRTVKRRAPKKKTKAQIHAMRVRQGKRLAAMRKSQLKGGRKKAKRKSRR